MFSRAALPGWALVAVAILLTASGSGGGTGTVTRPSDEPAEAYHWTNVTQGSYQPCCGPAVYDPVNRSVVATQLTSEFDNGSWTQVHGDPYPLSWDGQGWIVASATFVPFDQEVLGVAVSMSCAGQPSCEHRPTNFSLWTWADGSWTVQGMVPGSPYLDFPQVVFDSEDGYVLLSGPTWSGGDLNASTEETWTYSSGLWANITSSARSPLTDWFSWTDDPAQGVVLAFGGCRQFNCSAGDGQLTASFHGGEWTNLSPELSVAPSPRIAPALSYSSACGCVVLFGGGYDNRAAERFQALDDTWTYTAAGWTNDSGTGTSPPSFYNGANSMADDPVNDAVLLLGAGTWDEHTGSTWAWGNYTAPAPTVGSSPFLVDLLLVIALPAAVVVLLVLYVVLRRRRRPKVAGMPPVPPPPPTWA